jgi:hypothetical protein
MMTTSIRNREFVGVLNMFPLCSQMFLMGVPNGHHTFISYGFAPQVLPFLTIYK